MGNPPRKPPHAFLLFHLFLLLTTAPTPSHSLPYAQYKTLFSLSQHLLIRVSNLRAARGDISGSNRAKLIAQKIERVSGLGFWRFAWSAGWDYAVNYAWRDWDYRELRGVVSDSNKLLRFLGELTRVESETERASWVAINYGNVLRVSRSLLSRLLKLFCQSGTLKQVMETVQTEVAEGDLLRDCLEVGSNDLKGLIQIIKDLISQFSSTSDNKGEL